MAAMSLKPRARQRWPTDSGGCQSRRKWIPSSVKSVVTSESFPASRRSTAQSSPIPVRTARFGLPFRPRIEESAIRRMCVISAFSGSGTITHYTECLRVIHSLATNLALDSRHENVRDPPIVIAGVASFRTIRPAWPSRDRAISKRTPSPEGLPMEALRSGILPGSSSYPRIRRSRPYANQRDDDEGSG